MQFKPINTPGLINHVSGWLAQKRNYQWLDFGSGVQKLDPVSLAIMAQKEQHFLRVFTADDDESPIGVVGLSNVDRNFRTATAWIVLGEKEFSNKGYAARAVGGLLSFAFRDLQLGAVNVWAVECNHSSIRLIRRMRFNEIGRQRRCHYVDGRAYDRLLFDMLAPEYLGADHA